MIFEWSQFIQSCKKLEYIQYQTKDKQTFLAVMMICLHYLYGEHRAFEAHLIRFDSKDGGNLA